MEISNQSLKFHSDALPENALVLRKLHGWERLSGPFRFEMELVGKGQKDGSGIDLEAVLYQPAKVGILQRLGGDLKSFRWFQGAIESMEELEKGDDLADSGGKQGFEVCYRAVLVPDLARLRECHRSRVFQQLTIDELVTKVINRSLGLQAGQDFEFKLTRTKPGSRAERPVYPEREYVVQYEENDLDFIDRWLQHEGIFYLFENDGTREKVLFGDSSGAYKPVDTRGSTYPYRPKGSFHGAGDERGDKAEAEHVLSLAVQASRLPKQVRLNDYNWRDPGMKLQATKPVHEKGTGLQIQYNDHYKTPEQGAALAEVRAQELQCTSMVFRGTSSCRGFRPGRTFELSEHFHDTWNQTYLLTSVFHEASQAVNLEGSNVTAADYANHFEAIPATREFRPRRLTGWPSIHGVMNARIDGEGDGEVAELDDLGRYKVRFPFDENEADAAPGKASRWVRMAQPYAGPMAGMHFTLLKGTEVVVTHVDGDPDRPIISGALPNPDNVAPTHSGNPTQNQLMTVTGNQFQMDDNKDSNGFVLRDANRSFVMDLRSPSNGNGGGNGSGGGSGGEPRKRKPISKGPRPLSPPATNAPPGLHAHITPQGIVPVPSTGGAAGPVTDPALEAELQAKLGALGPGAPAEAHAAAFRSFLGLDQPDEASRRARLERLMAAGIAPGEPQLGGGSGMPPTAPATPTGFAAANTTPFTGVKLNWTPVSGATGYRIERQEQKTPLPAFASLTVISGGTVGEYVDATAAKDLKFNYRIVALGTAGTESSPSSAASIITPKTAQKDSDQDGTVESVEDEFAIGTDTDGSSDDDGYDPRNTQSISLLEDFLNYCDVDPSCSMRQYYTDGLALLNAKASTQGAGWGWPAANAGVTLPGTDPIYQLWARKFNAWLAIAWGGIGEITLNNCNQYTYVNNSYEVKFGTGGSTWDQVDGNSYTKKVVNGEQKEIEEITGNQSKDSTVIGNVDEKELSIGHKTKTGITIDTTREATIQIGAVAKAELELDATASTKFHLGVVTKFEIALDAEASISIQLGISAKVEIAASAEFKIELKKTKTLFEALANKLSIVVPKTTEVKLEEMEVKLQKTDAELNNTRNTLNDTKVNLNQTKTQLNQTKAQLNQTQNKLNGTDNALNETLVALTNATTALTMNDNGLSKNTTSIVNNLTSALHNIA